MSIDQTLRARKDIAWFVVWCLGIGILAGWNLIFLNKPAFTRIIDGFINTVFVGILTCVFTLVLGWITTQLLAWLETGRRRAWYLGVGFIFNLVRSIPQIVGILLGYVAIAFMAQSGSLRGGLRILPLMALFMSVFIFLEMSDLMRERINHFRKLDFYNAMSVCGISRFRIVNFDVLWKNSRAHVLNKLISVFGMAVFLQCSVDFVISVGLSTDVNQVNLPTTLGSMLARIDSKQDILAIGHSLMHPSYAVNLPFRHLQGISVAFLIVFTLLCVYNISNALVERYRL